MPPPASDVEAATLAPMGLPRLPEPPFSDVPRLLPRRIERVPMSIASPLTRPSQMAGGSASALSLSRPAQASLALQPIGSLSRPRRPLSRGSGPSGHPAEPLVSYQINRQFSGWIPPPLVIRAFGAHCQLQTSGFAIIRRKQAADANSVAGHGDLTCRPLPAQNGRSPSSVLSVTELWGAATLEA